MKKKTTIYDIATKLNITAATVSRALNDSELISKKTKKMVLEAADELSYFKNRHALALKSGRTNQVGLVVPFINRHFFSKITLGRTVENDFLNNILVAFLFSNLTLKVLHLQNFGGVFIFKFDT